MSGISRLTALEIFSNPGDLEFTIGQESKEGGKFGIAIFRGPGHRYKFLITSAPFAETLEAAIASIEGILTDIYETMTAETKDATTLTAAILNPEGGKVDPANSLNPDLIARIVKELGERRKASTCEMLPASAAG